MTIYNFSAGPATLPKPVLEKAQAEFLALVDQLTDEQKAELYTILKALIAEDEDKGGAA